MSINKLTTRDVARLKAVKAEAEGYIEDRRLVNASKLMRDLGHGAIDPLATLGGLTEEEAGAVVRLARYGLTRLAMQGTVYVRPIL